jgi:hypothetical protein
VICKPPLPNWKTTPAFHTFPLHRSSCGDNIRYSTLRFPDYFKGPVVFSEATNFAVDEVAIIRGPVWRYLARHPLSIAANGEHFGASQLGCGRSFHVLNVKN